MLTELKAKHRKELKESKEKIKRLASINRLSSVEKKYSPSPESRLTNNPFQSQYSNTIVYQNKKTSPNNKKSSSSLIDKDDGERPIFVVRHLDDNTIQNPKTIFYNNKNRLNKSCNDIEGEDSRDISPKKKKTRNAYYKNKSNNNIRYKGSDNSTNRSYSNSVDKNDKNSNSNINPYQEDKQEKQIKPQKYPTTIRKEFSNMIHSSSELFNNDKMLKPNKDNKDKTNNSNNINNTNDKKLIDKKNSDKEVTYVEANKFNYKKSSTNSNNFNNFTLKGDNKNNNRDNSRDNKYNSRDNSPDQNIKSSNFIYNFRFNQVLCIIWKTHYTTK